MKRGIFMAIKGAQILLLSYAPRSGYVTQECRIEYLKQCNEICSYIGVYIQFWIIRSRTSWSKILEKVELGH